MNERRITPRRSAEIETVLLVIHGEYRPIIAHLVDISEGGLAAQIPGPGLCFIEPGTKVTGTISGRHLRIWLEIVGQVVRCQPNRQETATLLGLNFDAPILLPDALIALSMAGNPA